MLIATIVTGMVAVLWAAVPPPPVNQTLGLYDTKYGSFTTADCHSCHGTDPELVVLHHGLMDSEGKVCDDCHIQISDGTGGFYFDEFRTCSKCHNARSPHHTSDYAVAQNCQKCHKLIDNPLDGHYIPTYGTYTSSTSVTPRPNGKTVHTTNGDIIVQGCAACHQANPSATPIIYSNADTHHGTGLGSTLNNPVVGQCTWCHATAAGSSTIRTCEKCHGVKSLHNIQVPTKTSTVVPGGETAGYGHIGNDWDCVGCHYSWVSASSTGGLTTAVIPAITGRITRVLDADKQTVLTLNGISFTNIGSNGVAYNPIISISNSTTSISVTPESVTVSEIKAVIPPLSKGIYELRVVKDDVQSNPIKLVVVPELAIKSAILSSSNTVTISGRGFGDTPPTDFKSGLGVFVGDVQAKILSWSDSRIVASSSAIKAGVTVKVQTLHGPVSKTVSAAAAKTRR